MVTLNKNACFGDFVRLIEAFLKAWIRDNHSLFRSIILISLHVFDFFDDFLLKQQKNKQ